MCRWMDGWIIETSLNHHIKIIKQYFIDYIMACTLTLMRSWLFGHGCGVQIWRESVILWKPSFTKCTCFTSNPDYVEYWVRRWSSTGVLLYHQNKSYQIRTTFSASETYLVPEPLRRHPHSRFILLYLWFKDPNLSIVTWSQTRWGMNTLSHYSPVGLCERGSDFKGFIFTIFYPCRWSHLKREVKKTSPKTVRHSGEAWSIEAGVAPSFYKEFIHRRK